jgi:hemolysin activation/secretion protein
VALAQTPAPADPGIIFREQLPRPDYEVVPGPVIQQQKPQEAPGGADQIRFELVSVEVKGVTVYDDAAIGGLLDPLVGTEVSVGDLYDLANSITSLYASDGYALSFAVVPAQEVEGGRVMLQVVEGYISDVQFQNLGALDGPFLPNNLGFIEEMGERIKASRPLNLADLERYLLLMNDLPGVRARSVVQPAPATPGASVLLVDLERKRVGGGVNLTNRVNDLYAELEAGADFVLNGAIDETDGLRISHRRAVFEDSLDSTTLRYNRMLTSDGLRLDLLANYGTNEPRKGILSTLGFEGEELIFGAQLTYPVIRSREENLNLGVGFQWSNDETEVLGTTLTEDDIRKVQLRADYQMVDVEVLDMPAVTNVCVGVDVGLGILGATDDSDPRLQLHGFADRQRWIAPERWLEPGQQLWRSGFPRWKHVGRGRAERRQQLPQLWRGLSLHLYRQRFQRRQLGGFGRRRLHRREQRRRFGKHH